MAEGHFAGLANLREFYPAMTGVHHRKVPKRLGLRDCWFCGVSHCLS